MSLYGLYIKARENMDIVECTEGFATYKIEGDTVYLRDIFVIEAARRHGIAKELADKVCAEAKAKGCKKLIGSVSPQDPKATENIAAMLFYKMRLLNASPELILFQKEL